MMFASWVALFLYVVAGLSCAYLVLRHMQMDEHSDSKGQMEVAAILAIMMGAVWPLVVVAAGLILLVRRTSDG